MRFIDYILAHKLIVFVMFIPTALGALNVASGVNSQFDYELESASNSLTHRYAMAMIDYKFNEGTKDPIEIILIETKKHNQALSGDSPL